MKRTTVSAVSRAAAPSIIIVCFLLIASASMLSSCVPSGAAKIGKSAAPTASGKPQSGLTTAALFSGSAQIVAELAITDEEQEIGLMHRKELPDGEGMLFMYSEDRRLSFWMKNTLIPLSIAYISADGVIKEIRDMEALSLAPVESERYVRYALEAPFGWFNRVGLAVGDRFDLSAVPALR